MRNRLNDLIHIPVRSFQFRLLVYLLIFGTITLIGSILVVYMQSTKYAQTELKTYVNKAHEQAVQKIQQELLRVHQTAVNFNADYSIQLYVAAPNSAEELAVKNDVDSIIARYQKNSPYIKDICVYFNEKGISICSNTDMLSNIERIVNRSQPQIEAYTDNGRLPNGLRIIEPIYDLRSLALKGQIIMIMDFGKLLSDIQQYYSVDKHAVFDRDGNIIYSNYPTKHNPRLVSQGGKSREFTRLNNDSMISQRIIHLSDMNWTSRMEVKSEFFTASWRSLRNTFLLFFAFLFILSGIGSLIFTRVIIKPLNHLRILMKRAENGDLKAYWTSASTQEINDLGEGFNQMLNRVEELFKQVKQEEALKKEAEIAALQYQLNPHFLYNTLNTIKWVAKIHKTPQISEVVSALVRLLQASLGKKGDFITLRDEIRLIKDYMDIQAFRYEEQVKVVYDIDDVASLCLVPRMILQPLVENALIHGIESTKEGIITIKAWLDRDLLMCQVEDNGRGVPEAMLRNEGAEQKGVKEKMSGIGLKHIREKIKLYYGPNYKMHIFSKPNQGATIRLSLPIHRGEE